MADKTQKITERLHHVLKMQALREGKTLQQLTEELLTHGLQSRGVDFDGETDGDKNAGGNKKGSGTD